MVILLAKTVAPDLPFVAWLPEGADHLATRLRAEELFVEFFVALRECDFRQKIGTASWPHFVVVLIWLPYPTAFL